MARGRTSLGLLWRGNMPQGSRWYRALGAGAGGALAFLFLSTTTGLGAEPTHWIEPLLERVKPESTMGLALTFTFLGFLPGILITLTAYARIIIVLTFVRHGLSLQQTPPNAVLAGLAIFLTWFTMAPVVERLETRAIQPLIQGEIPVREALERARVPLVEFMLRQTSHREIGLFLELARAGRPSSPRDIPLRVLAPAFILSELKAGFQIGVLILLPFVLIDLVLGVLVTLVGVGASPPPSVSLAVKLALFTAVDGWVLIAGSLVRSFN